MEKINYTEVNKSIALAGKILKIFYYVIIIGIFYLIMQIMNELQVLSFIGKVFGILLPLILGMLIAWLLNPLVSYLCRNNFKRLGASVIVYIVILVFLYLFIAMLIPVISKQVDELISALPDITSKISSWLINITKNFDGIDGIDTESIKENIVQTITTSGNFIITNIPNYLISLLSGIVSFLGLLAVGLVIGFYLLINFDSTLKNLSNLISNHDNRNVLSLLRKINVQMYRYVKGTLLSASILFVFSTLAFMIIGLKVPLLFGMFCAITNIIPFVGPYIGGIPAVLFAYTQSTTTGLLCLIVIVVTQLIESNIITPLIMSKTMKLHPVTVIVTLLIFGSFFGIIGMLVAVPIISILKVIYDNKDDYLIKKSTSSIRKS